ncbi:phospholipase A1-like [Chironomus tepperi]|uniref:phospholipase A1-like n=1 Tax=Chironomus tepperi TaxID=113505 RepID=UPI00391F40B9
MINEFLKLRGNCVFFMDYSFYSSGGYFVLTPHFNAIANLLSEKILKISVPQNVVLFGFSFGARLVTKAGALIANSEASKVDKIYACDPAGPGFDPIYRLDPKTSANFVQCIHTSNTYGTKVYNCHQDWRMGVCGHKQNGAGPFPYGSHGLCPYFFLSSFSENFTQNNAHDCRSRRVPKDLPDDLIMGPREFRLIYSGDIFAPTAKSPPWSGFNESSRKNVIDFFEDDEDAFGEEYYNELKEHF